jgi:Cu/Ag efflux pump CusA
MTSLITVLALTPQMLGSDIGSIIQLPLSLTLLGGMFIGTPISLFVIPIAYMYSVKFGNKIRTWTRFEKK